VIGGEEQLGVAHRDPYTTTKIYRHALPDTDLDVAATWDKLMVENAASKLLAQIGTSEEGKKPTMQ
jgi:hypothetical protein